MPISYQYKTIFIHIPKCAGTSLEKMLGMATDTELFSYKRAHRLIDINIPKEKFTEDEYQICISKTPQHFTSNELKKILSTEVYDSYFKFCVVRNPFERLISEYNYLIAERSNVGVTDFNSLIRLLDTEPKERIRLLDGHLETQSSFITDENGNIDSSIKIYKFEEVNKCFENISKICNITTIPHSRKSEKAWPLSEYYTNDIVAKVVEFYKEDFENFGYSTNFG